MNIVEINGGLGNQVTQYAFARYLDTICGFESVLFDDMFFDVHKDHNGLEIPTLFKNAKYNSIKANFDADVWVEMCKSCYLSGRKTRIVSIFLEHNIDFNFVCDEFVHSANGELQGNLTYDGPSTHLFWQDINTPTAKLINDLKQIQNLYWCGAWLDPAFGLTVKKIIENELKFPELIHEQNIKYKEDIESKELSVGLHVRRGDFVELKRENSAQKIATKIKNLKLQFTKEQKPKPSFYIFSDDINWCKENLNKLGFRDNDYTVFIEGNDVEARNYIDMQLMTYCDYLVRNHTSSFCMAAKLISEKDITLVKI